MAGDPKAPSQQARPPGPDPGAQGQTWPILKDILLYFGWIFKEVPKTQSYPLPHFKLKQAECIYRGHALSLAFFQVKKNNNLRSNETIGICSQRHTLSLEQLE